MLKIIAGSKQLPAILIVSIEVQGEIAKQIDFQ